MRPFLQNNFTINILLFLYFIVLLTHCVTIKEFQSFITQNSSKIWLQNNTIFDDSISNTFCEICCLQIKDDLAKKVCGKHTLCRYPSDAPGPNCRGLILMEFSPEEKLLIVDVHNTIRSKIASGKEDEGNPGPQPKAADMRQVSWDEELEMLAGRWARQCAFSHDICRDVERFPVGQNIARGGFAINNDMKFIIKWYEFVKLANETIIQRYTLTSTDALSQYTQLVWSETYLIGCARVAFQLTGGADVTFREHFICNYGPTGNFPGRAVYKIGEPCSDCPLGTVCSSEYEGLCGAETAYEIKFKNKTLAKRVAANRSYLKEVGICWFLLSEICLISVFVL